MKARLPRTVIVLGVVSLFNDLASEMVVPLIPILLGTVLAAGPTVLGLVEGVADAVASLLKLWSGRRSDLMGGRRKGLTLAGYLLSNLARPLLGLAATWPAVLLFRSMDRVGKGVRSAPRDALVSDVVTPQIRGFAYGFHRAMDNCGAVGGSLMAAAILAWSAWTPQQVILWSAVPGTMAVLLIAAGIGEPKTAAADNRLSQAPLRWSSVPAGMRHYLLILGLFTFARASETFIILRGKELGVSTVELLLLWAGLNVAKALTATRGGILSDRLGKLLIVEISWAAHALSFLLLATAQGSLRLWAITLLYGLFSGLSEGPERARISDLAGSEDRGTAFGWYHLILGIAAIPAGLIFGGIWQEWGAAPAFAYAGCVAAVSTLLLAAHRRIPATARG
jgi:sugar phosphate permease